MKLYYLTFFFILLVSESLTAVARDTEIVRVSMSAGSSSTQIFITFTEAPPYTYSQKGKRIDITLDADLRNSEPLPFTADDKVVKFLTQEDEGQTTLSFFLRHVPQKVQVSGVEAKTIVVDILLGNQFTSEFPELTSRLEGISVETDQGKDFSNPYISSPYSGNWHSFFANFQPDIVTSAPMKYSIPSFPIIALIPDVNSHEILPEELFSLSIAGKWNEMVPLVFELFKNTQDQQEQKMLALTLGEILLRADNYPDSYKQLFLLKENYTEQFVGIAAAYLLGLLRAEHENPYIADNQFRQLERYIEADFALSPYLLLSQVETTLTTNQVKRTDSLLRRDDIAMPPKLAALRDLRQADYWFATKDYIKAYVGYQLFEDKTTLAEQPFSLNGYCNTLYHQKKYIQTSQCLQQLISVIDENSFLGLISYKKALAELTFKNSSEMYAVFSAIEDSYPDTEAAYRAELKRYDIRYLSQPSWRKTSVHSYRSLAENATDREVAAEAALKEAIAYSETGDIETSMDRIQQFLRDFHASPLKETAQALLIEILPQELNRLLSSDNYVDAIVLAKQNRLLFQKEWVDIELLHILAKAYHQLGIFSEARNLYLYLLATSSEEQKESYYLPLVSIMYNQGDYDMVEDYATRYTYNYPTGNALKNINFFRLQSLVASGKNSQALELLSDPLPDILQVREIAATLHYIFGQYKEVVSILTPFLSDGSALSMDALFILGESLYQENSFTEAAGLFHRTKDQEKFFDHARYRLAEIESGAGNTETSLNLFREIVEKGYDPLWQKLAEKELQLHDIDKNY
ncbi:MAG: hypothetical protein V2I36_15850 [Desulfopila sp.]|jgi:TolA-binding protein|nr:hypothetical protein [Desulfopila sp.]